MNTAPPKRPVSLRPPEEGADPPGAAPRREVGNEELASLKEEVFPPLLEFQKSPPAFEEWQEKERAKFAEVKKIIAGSISVSGGATEMIGLWDVLFAILGMGTAFRLGAGLTSEE